MALSSSRTATSLSASSASSSSAAAFTTNPSSCVKFQVQSIKVFPKLAVLDGTCTARKETLIRSIREGERCLVHVRPETEILFASGNRSISTVRGLCEQLVGAPLWTANSSNSSSRWIEIKDAIVIVVALSSGSIERNRKGVKIIEATKVYYRTNNDDDNDDNEGSNSNSNKNNKIEFWDNDDDNKEDDLSHDDALEEKDQRHELFAKWLVETFGVETLSAGTGVLDVAGGNGKLSRALVQDWGVPSTLVDPNPRCCADDTFPIIALPLHGDGSNLTNRAGDDRTQDIVRSCSAIVGMHPDQATEAIVDTALRLGVPFAVLPCCVMPSLFPLRRQKGRKNGHLGDPVRSYSAFCQYLQDKAPEAKTEKLPFVGRNKVIFGIP